MPGYMGACKGKAGMKARYCAAEISGRKDPRCGDMRQYSALACRAVLSLSRRGEPDARILRHPFLYSLHALHCKAYQFL